MSRRPLPPPPKRILVLQHEPGDDLRQWRAFFERRGARMIRVDFLGGQLAAAALGARVSKSRRAEIGWFRLRSGARAFQWHRYEFGLPEGAERLDSSPACANQAFRLGSVLATQFHFEVDRRTISAWLAESSSLSGRRKARIAAETGRCLRGSRRLGRRWFGVFLRLVRG